MASNAIQDDCLYRERQITRNKRNPTSPIIPVASSTWWNGVRTGRFPPGKKLGRMHVWTGAELREIVESDGDALVKQCTPNKGSNTP